MSDPFHDAYRPDNKPKGFGWWDKEDQKEYVLRLFEVREATDQWILDFMVWNNMITRQEWIDYMKFFHMDELIRLGYKDEDVDQGKLF